MPDNARVTPLEYLRVVADWVRVREQVPMTWAHVVFVSLDTAMSYTPYKAEPKLRLLRDGLRSDALNKLGKEIPVSGLGEGDLVEAVGVLNEYERGRNTRLRLEQRFLRWLSDRPRLGRDDWTLGIWHRLLQETGVEPGHFDGTMSWSTGARQRGTVTQKAKEHWSDALDGLVGLERVKKHIREVQALVEIDSLRKRKGLCENEFCLHQVFMGNPGTGKTSVARILGQIYSEFGFLTKGHLVEVDRAQLVGDVVGAAETNTEKVVKDALGGVLFIDEAYSLSSGGEQDFGARVIDTLVKRMEDYRHDLVVIVAGYEKKMNEFVHSNPGLRSRFTLLVHFDDYREEELLQIFSRIATGSGFQIDDMVLEGARMHLRMLSEAQGDEFGNAREVRTLWEATLRRQAARLVAERRSGQNIDGLLMEVRPEDIPDTATRGVDDR